MKLIDRFAGIILVVILLLLPAASVAQEEAASGALGLDELEGWLIQLEEMAAAQLPLNAPVGEESLTPDGYAFLYNDFTLYRDSPAPDSRLQAVALTEAACPGPRGLGVGDDQSRLLAAYGWQNPGLLGDGTVAALYLENELPADARWAWAIHSGENLLSVQCALHSALGDGLYTDMGVRYQLADGKVERIQLYGLANTFVQSADVLANLESVSQLMAQLSGDDRTAAGRWRRSEAAAFGPEDLTFGGMDFLTMRDPEVSALYGDPLTTDVLPDAEGLLYLTTERDGLSIGYLENVDGTMVQAQSVDITTPMIEGPRGLRVGMTLEEAVMLMRCDGSGQVLGSANVLYGDGLAAPYGLEESDGMGGTVLRYLCEAEGPNGLLTVTLYLSFQQDLLSEIYLYAW